MDVSNHIKKILVLIGAGASNIPINTPEVKQYDFLVRSYKNIFSNYSFEEIEYAFELAMKNVITYKLTLYNNPFSVGYVGELMKLYRDWRKKESDYQKTKIVLVPEKTPQEILEYMKKAVVRAFDEYKKGNPEFVKFHIYDWMDRNKFIDITSERKNYFFAEAKKQIDAEFEVEKELSVSPNEVQKIIDKYSGTTKQINLAKELALKEYFDGLIEMDINISDRFNAA